MRDVYLLRDIPSFVMYYIYSASGSSLIIEFTDSMIYLNYCSGLKCLLTLGVHAQRGLQY